MLHFVSIGKVRDNLRAGFTMEAVGLFFAVRLFRCFLPRAET
jgi:hypothetical protein